MLQARPIFDPVPGHEDEAVEHHARANDGDVLEGFLENDEDVAMHAGGVGDPPEIEPVAVKLVVCYHHHSLREPGFQSAVFALQQLTADGGMAAYSDYGRGEPLGYGDDEDAERLLGEGHVGVVVVFVDDIQRAAEGLGRVDGAEDEESP